MKKTIKLKYTALAFFLCLYCSALSAQKIQSEAVRKVAVCDSDKQIELGYYSQKSHSVTGAVATVSGSELDRSPVSRLSLSLAGLLPGLTTKETSSQLSKENTTLLIRGRHTINSTGLPLILIDGVVAQTSIYESITPEQIESISILKDASTQAIYGVQGANGVIAITTKKGSPGTLKVNASLENSFQQVSTKPAFINSWEYATMRNQAAANDGLTLPFTDAQVALFKSGTDRQKYPNTNWYELFMNDLVMQQRASVTLNGGNDHARFYANVNMVNQGSQFSSDNSKYNASDGSQLYNYRSNIDVKLFDDVSLFFRSCGSIGRDRTPSNSGVGDLYQSLFLMPSTTYGPCTPDGKVIATSLYNNPTYGMLNRSGFTTTTSANTISQLGLTYDLSKFVRGLNVSGFGAFETYGYGTLIAAQTYERWIRTDTLDNFSFTKKGDEINSSLTYSKPCNFSYQLVFSGNVHYTKTVGKHEIQAVAFATYQNYSSPDYSYNTPYLYPYKRIISGAVLDYGFDSRYFAKVDMGYSGSDLFPSNNRFFATPAVAAGWIASNEKFFKWKDYVSYLKFRYSYGKTANDVFGSNRYPYKDYVTYTNGGPIANLQNLITELGYADPNVQPEIVNKQNLGIDLEIAHALLVNVDCFDEHIDNMYINSSTDVPGFQGIPLSTYPYTNSGKMQNKGFELAMTYTKAVSKDFNLAVGGNVSYSKNTITKVGEVELGETYQYKYRTTGYSYGQAWGYLVDKSNGNGYFNSAEELQNSNLTYDFGTPRVGDLKYKDLNGDHIINVKDMAPLGSGSIPRWYYGINASASYKNFDLNLTCQGIGTYKVLESGYGIDETLLNGVYSSIHTNAWTTERYANHEKITYPALSTNSSTNTQSSDFYLNNKAYLRLRNIELGYVLPAALTQKVNIEKVRVSLSGHNLLTFSNMKFDDFGPEGTYTSIPVYKTYNVGLQLYF